MENLAFSPNKLVKAVKFTLEKNKIQNYPNVLSKNYKCRFRVKVVLSRKYDKKINDNIIPHIRLLMLVPTRWSSLIVPVKLVPIPSTVVGTFSHFQKHGHIHIHGLT
jgi:hypothetical protein